MEEVVIKCLGVLLVLFAVVCIFGMTLLMLTIVSDGRQCKQKTGFYSCSLTDNNQLKVKVE